VEETMMREWSVRFNISRPEVTFTEEHVDAVLDALSTQAASGTYSPHELSMRFTMVCPTPIRAVREGFDLFVGALGKAGIPPGEEGVVEAGVEAVPDLERRIGESNLPDLVGVAEVARLLNVSKQRASELARSPEFPRPIEVLAAGPIWRKTAILRHVGLWPRKAGRPRKRVTQAVRP
jgi:hypothetical protein